MKLLLPMLLLYCCLLLINATELLPKSCFDTDRTSLGLNVSGKSPICYEHWRGQGGARGAAAPPNAKIRVPIFWKRFWTLYNCSSVSFI